MKFGLHNPSFQPVSGGPESIFPELREKAQWLEANGFDYMSVMDHLNQIPGVGGAEEPFMEAWVTLGALANATSKLYLTTMVSSVSYRNPALLAKMVTTLDLISGGRAILGIGGGWYEAEYEGYGYEFPRPGVRLSQLREGVQIIKTMWAETPATYEGKHFVVRGAVTEPKPLQGRPRVLIGGGGEKVTLRIVAQEADIANISAPPETFARKVELLRGYCAEAGRDLKDIEITRIDRIYIAPIYEGAEEKWRAAGGREVEGYKGLVGTPGDVIKTLRQFEGSGMDGVFISGPNHDAESRELFAKEVMPAFK